MDLKTALNTLTVKQLREICANRRLWGVYSSRTAYTGYSKCKNKKELIDFIIAYHESSEVDYTYDEGKHFWRHERVFTEYSIKNNRVEGNPLFSVIYCKLNKKNLYVE